MKKILLTLLFSFCAWASSAQTLVECDEKTSFFAVEKDGVYFAVKLVGKATTTKHPSLIIFEGYIMQTLLIPVKEHTKNGTDDLSVTISHALSEAEYLSGVLKKRVDIGMEKLDLDNGKKALFWYYDIPQPPDNQEKKSELTVKFVKQVSFSVVLEDKIYSVAATLSDKQNLEDLKKTLLTIANTAQRGKGKLNPKKLCKTK